MNPTYPKFSVSMCVYGGDNPDFFDAAVNSIIDQSVPPNELVLAVDGPIPDSIEAVIQKYRNRLKNAGIGFSVIYLRQNRGHGEARRTSFEHCTYDLIALMDADDLSVHDRFEQQLKLFAQDASLSVAGGNIHEFIGDPSDCVGRRIVPQTDAEIKKYMQKRCPMNQVTVMFRKSDVAEVGGYVDWYCDEDYYLWVRLELAGKKFANVPSKLCDVRVGEDMYRRRGGGKYFRSEARLQGYMLRHGLIGPMRYLINVSERLILQVLMPNRVRGFVFQKLART